MKPIVVNACTILGKAMRTEDLVNLVGSGAQADVYCIGYKAIKVFKEHCSKEDVFYEEALHSMIESTKLPVPKVYEVIQIDNRMAIVMDMIEGISLKDIILNDLENVDIYMNTLIDLQIRVHNINTIRFPNMKEKLIQLISVSNILSNEQKMTSLNGCLSLLVQDCLKGMKLKKTNCLIGWINDVKGIEINTSATVTFLSKALMAPAVHCRNTLSGSQLIVIIVGQSSNTGELGLREYLHLMKRVNL